MSINQSASELINFLKNNKTHLGNKVCLKIEDGYEFIQKHIDNMKVMKMTNKMKFYLNFAEKQYAKKSQEDYRPIAAISNAANFFQRLPYDLTSLVFFNYDTKAIDITTVEKHVVETSKVTQPVVETSKVTQPDCQENYDDVNFDDYSDDENDYENNYTQEYVQPVIQPVVYIPVQDIIGEIHRLRHEVIVLRNQHEQMMYYVRCMQTNRCMETNVGKY
jgi:hypothetical protein